jgi:hypothetical protein
MPSKWYYEKGGVRKGPVSSDDIRRMVADGTLLPTDLLWKEGMKDWMPAGKSPNLFPGNASPAIPRPTSNTSNTSVASANAHQRRGKRAGCGYGLWSMAGVVMLLVVGAVAASSLYRLRRSPQVDGSAEPASAPTALVANSQSPAASSGGMLTAQTKTRSWGKREGDKSTLFLDFTTITPEEAKEVVDFNPEWGISFDQLEELTPEVAAELRKYKGLWIAFRKPIQIDADAAKQLCGFRGELGMMGISEVTPEFCRLFTEHRGELNLGDVTVINDAVASALSERPGGLKLPELRSVTASQLALLLNVRGPLEVGGVGQLGGAEWYEALTGRSARTTLRGDTDARGWGGYVRHCIRQHDPSLFLKNVHYVPDDLAREIADKQGHISFAEDAKMSPAARAILDERNKLIDLVVVEHLTEWLAEGIATRARIAREATQGPLEVNLSRVRELNPAFKIMEELTRFDGTLSLGVLRLSDYDAEVVGSGRLFEIHLPALEITSEKALCSLAKAKEMTLNLPTLLSLSDEFAAALEDHEGWLILEGLRSLTDGQVESLSRKKGTLRFSENLQLTPRQIEILSARKTKEFLGGDWVDPK